MQVGFSETWNGARLWLLMLVVVIAVSVPVEAASLKGSRSSLKKQNQVARQHNYSYLRNDSQVRTFVRSGYIVPIRGNSDFELVGVSSPYARPELELFLNRLASQYRDRCGEKLVVTSLTRPKSRQPRNASPLSVHPTGMALDLRVPRSSACRRWLEDTLLSLERSGVLDATRERRPPHYHVAVYPRQYVSYVAKLTGSKPEISRPAATLKKYKVQKGDSLWLIARKHGTSVASIKKVNDLGSNLIKPGDSLRIP
ncbi:MAG: LysM peptidoglycan-binding domain-containing protein [Acidobacteria bacterium]|nr:LysM peptidoglycan-binding domain-containing protein [Acidobacteriota bacterium]